MGLWRERRSIKNAQFCPWCGVNSIVRYGKEDIGRKAQDKGCEFWCTTCGSSFKLDRSNRYRQAEELIARERQVRPE